MPSFKEAKKTNKTNPPFFIDGTNYNNIFSSIGASFNISCPFDIITVSHCYFDKSINFSDLISKLKLKYSKQNPNRINFNNCYFCCKVKFRFDDITFDFRKCHISTLNIFDSLQGNQHLDKQTGIIRDSRFYNSVDISNNIIQKRMIISDSYFYDDVKITNNEGASRFQLNRCKFHCNFSFTYNVLSEKIYMTSCKFYRLIDITINGVSEYVNLNYIEFDEPNKILYRIKKTDDENQKLLKHSESLRILKTQALSNNDFVSSAEYRRLEYEFLLEHLKRKNTPQLNAKRINLALNKVSNNFGTDWQKGVVFTLKTGSIAFILAIIPYTPFNYPLWCNLPDFGIQYLNFLNPFSKPQPTPSYGFGFWFYFCFIVGKIFLTYGYYQTIQAFRRYR